MERALLLSNKYNRYIYLITSMPFLTSVSFSQAYRIVYRNFVSLFLY